MGTIRSTNMFYVKILIPLETSEKGYRRNGTKLNQIVLKESNDHCVHQTRGKDVQIWDC